MKKLCEICGKEPATIPDRNRTGRPINRVCYACHRLRLLGDLEEIKKRKLKTISKENAP